MSLQQSQGPIKYSGQIVAYPHNGTSMGNLIVFPGTPEKITFSGQTRSYAFVI